MIRGITSNESSEDLPTPAKNRKLVIPKRASDPPQIVVTTDYHDATNPNRLVLVGINARDRPGLLLDISKGLLRLELQLRHTEAAVIDDRSVSIWRCEFLGADFPDIEEIWSVLNVSSLLIIAGSILRINMLSLIGAMLIIIGTLGGGKRHFCCKDAWSQGNSCSSDKRFALGWTNCSTSRFPREIQVGHCGCTARREEYDASALVGQVHSGRHSCSAGK